MFRGRTLDHISMRPGGVEQYAQHLGPLRDPSGGIKNNTLAQENIGSFCVGIVIASLASLRCYLVATSNSRRMRFCRGLDSNLGPLSVSSLHMYPPGTRVLIYDAPGTVFGIILGSIPSEVDERSLPPHDGFLILPRAGYRYDAAHWYPVANRLGHGFAHFGDGRGPELLPGEFGYMTVLGLGLYVGQAMATLRATDLARVDAFYQDHLLRLTGHNTEQWAAGYERQWKEDEGEISGITAWTTYAWESLGLDRPGSGATRSGTYRWLQDDREEASAEPTEQRATGRWRRLTLEGYLGDLEQHYVLAPIGNLPTADTTQPYHALARWGVQQDGTIELTSAKGVFLRRTPLIPAPVQRHALEDPRGDRASGGYVPAHGAASGQTNVVPEFEWGGIPRSAMIYEFIAHTFNDRRIRHLSDHAKDWKVPQISEMSLGSIRSPRTPWVDLLQAFEAPEPLSSIVPLDAGRTTRIYQGEAFIGILDDGSISIRDAWGTELMLSRGNMYLSAAADTIVRNGRSFVCLAPRDVVMRAGRSADLTAGKGDVRIKSERNMALLAGNSGSGGILLESRSTGVAQSYEGVEGEDVVSSGIVLKSEQSPVLVHARQIYASTNGSGPIVLDADRGRGTIYSSAATQLISVRNQLTVAMGQDQANPRDVLALGSGGMALSVPLLVDGNATFIGSGNVVVNGTLQARRGLAAPNQLNAKPDERTLGPYVDRLTSSLRDAHSSISQSTTTFASFYYGDGGWGTDSFWRLVAHSLRRSEDYGTDDSAFVWADTPWQQLMRQAGISRLWDEPPVLSNAGRPTYPYPGRLSWAEEQRYRLVGDTNIDPTTGVPRDRPYANSSPSATPALMRDVYVVAHA